MADIYRDDTDRKIISLVQAEFPLTGEPYTDLGQRLGISGQEVRERIGQLKENGLIRQISPVLETRRLGFQSTLVAMKVAERRLDSAEEIIAGHPGVSHGYLRNHDFNVWFTLAIPPDADIDSEIEKLTGPIEPEAIFALPSIKVFKIGAYFDVAEDMPATTGVVVQADGVLPDRVELLPADKLVINELQQDLPLIETPFQKMAENVGMNVEQFLAQAQSLLQRGIMRRYGASINHRRAGFQANSMTCWQVSPEKVSAVGQELAALKEVSHCYERKTNPLWSYNIFAMIHGDNRQLCQDIANDISRQFDLDQGLLLISTREFKKTRVKYLV